MLNVNLLDALLIKQTVQVPKPETTISFLNEASCFLAVCHLPRAWCTLVSTATASRAKGRAQLQVVEDVTAEHVSNGWEAPLIDVSAVSPECNALVPFQTEPNVPNAGQSKKRTNVGKRLDWHQVAQEIIPQDQGLDSKQLRASSKKWLKDHGYLTRTLATSSYQKRTALIAECDSCLSCTRAWCFTFRCDSSSSSMVVEEKGSCSGEKNTKRLKREHARKFAVQGSAAKALIAIQTAGLPDEEMPSLTQLAHQRKKKRKGKHSTQLSALAPSKHSLKILHLACTCFWKIVNAQLNDCLFCLLPTVYWNWHLV